MFSSVSTLIPVEFSGFIPSTGQWVEDTKATNLTKQKLLLHILTLCLHIGFFLL